MKKLLLFLYILTCFTSSLYAQDATSLKNMLQNAEKLPHNESRLKALLEIAKLSINDIETCKYYCDILLDESEKQNNDYYKCEAYYTKLIVAYNAYDAGLVQSITEKLIPLSRSIERYDMMFRAWRCQIDYMFFTQDYERNEKEAKKLLAEAVDMNNSIGIQEGYMCLANIYNSTFRENEAIEVLEKALPLSLSLKQTANVTNIMQQLLFLYADVKRYAPWEKALQAMENYLNDDSIEATVSDAAFAILNTSYADYYTQLKELPQAAKRLNQAERYLEKLESPLYLFHYECIRANYFTENQEYDKALQSVDKSIEIMESMSRGVNYYTQVLTKAKILVNLNRTKDAVPLFQEVLTFRDSLHVQTLKKQYEQVKNDFNADQILLNRAKIRQQTQHYILLLLGIGLIAIVIFAVYMMRVHRALRKAESEMRTMTHSMELINEAKNRFLSNISTTIREPLNTVVEGSLRLATEPIEDVQERRRFSSEIRKMSYTLINMLNDILDLSRLQAGMMKFEINDVEVNSTITDVVNTSQTMKERISVNVQYPDSTLLFVKFDALRLQQIIRGMIIPIDTDKGMIDFTLSKDDENVFIRISGSALANSNPPQQFIIRNEINRMLILHFKGSFEIDTDSAVITLSLPLSEVVNAE